MALVNMTQMLNKAYREKYAVGAFNILDYNSCKAVIVAAKELNAPVIIQTSVKTVKFWGAKTIMNWVTELAENVQIPIAIHLDHCTDIDVLKECVEAGWTSVMYDGSAKPFSVNLTESKQVVEIAHPNNVSVEIELGAIVGVEDDIHISEQDANLADLSQSIEICEKVKPDCFAPAIGTAHGIYSGTPKIDYQLLAEVSEKTKIPIALHGGTGLADEVFLKCISLGCAKVNISTQLKYAFIDAFVNYYSSNKTQYNPLAVLEAQFNEMKKGIQEKIKLFGGENKA